MCLGVVVGRDVVVVADADVLGEGEDTEQHECRRRGREAPARPAKDAPAHGADRRQHGQVAEDEGADRDAEELEPDGVQVVREGSVALGDVSVEGVALRQVMWSSLPKSMWTSARFFSAPGGEQDGDHRFCHGVHDFEVHRRRRDD